MSSILDFLRNLIRRINHSFWHIFSFSSASTFSGMPPSSSQKSAEKSSISASKAGCARSLLYLGLDPPPDVYHYPVIRTEKIEGEEYNQARHLWPTFSHVIFTSKTAVHYWSEPWTHQIALAIGEGTANALRARGVEPILAPFPTQEGMIVLLKTLTPAFLFLPHSKRARPLLQNFLISIPHFILDLYDTHFQKLEPVPELSQFNEIIFTSPSTVDGFLKIFDQLPKEIKLTPIGPITERKIKEVY